MKKVNSLMIFNAAPHDITFVVGEEMITVEKDAVINACVEERVLTDPLEMCGVYFVSANFVTPEFIGNDEGKQVIMSAFADKADLVIGSTIAAQAYPGDVVATVPAPGYEHCEPSEKRMRADRFVVFH